MQAAAEVAWANSGERPRTRASARAFIEQAREAVARLTGFDARDVILTSGGTEANNLALATRSTSDPGRSSSRGSSTRR